VTLSELAKRIGRRRDEQNLLTLEKEKTMAEPAKKNKDQQNDVNIFDVHRQIVGWLFLSTVCIVIIVGVLLWSFYAGQNATSMLLIVLLAGILGGFVSALKRIYDFQSIFPLPHYHHFLKKSNLYLVMYSMIPPLVGAIGAVILYVIFASKIITGPLFPSFSCGLGPDKCNDLKVILHEWRPSLAEDYAKVVVWGFIAGFSERFVPDILNRLSKQGTDNLKRS
jgi:hypothetical protein